MKKEGENSTTNYAPEQVSEGVEIHFTKIATGSRTTISGRIKKDGSDAGSVSYDTAGNYLITSLKPYGLLTCDDVKAVYAAVPGCIAEMTND